MCPQLPVQPSIECLRTDTLSSNPNLVFDGTCHKTQSQTNRHPSIDRHSRRGNPLPLSIRLVSTCALTLSRRGGRLEQERGRVVGGGGGCGHEGARGRRGGGERVSFYFNGKGEEEDSPSESDDDSDSSEDEWGEGREDGEDADKDKKIKTAWAVFTMTCLDFVLDEIKPLHVEVQEPEGLYLVQDKVEARHGENCPSRIDILLLIHILPIFSSFLCSSSDESESSSDSVGESSYSPLL